MHKLFGRSLFFGIAGLAVFAMFTLNSCRDKYSTQVDTVYVHTPGCDSMWMYVQTGTTSTLLISQFTDGLKFPLAEWNVGGTNGVVLRSTDTGKTWPAVTPIPDGTTIYGIWFFDQLNGVVAGDDGMMWRTNDGGKSWSSNSIGSLYPPRRLYFVDKNIGFIVTSDQMDDAISGLPGKSGEILKTTDGGMTWANVYTANAGLYDVQFTSATEGIASGKFGTVLVTTDAGNTWTLGNSGVNGNITHATYAGGSTMYAVSLGNSNAWPADTVGGAIIKTTDGGMTWQSIQTTTWGIESIATNGKGVITAIGIAGNIIESRYSDLYWTPSVFGNDLWYNIEYAAPYRAVLIGRDGHLATRDR
jgi:photosystem II stability/assembly factor-like uncharacterized protein